MTERHSRHSQHRVSVQTPICRQQSTAWRQARWLQFRQSEHSNRWGKTTSPAPVMSVSTPRTILHNHCAAAISNIVISLSKICDRDWSYTGHVICTNNHCWPCSGAAVKITGQHYQSTLPAGLRTSSHAFAADFWSERYIRHINYIFCAAKCWRRKL